MRTVPVILVGLLLIGCAAGGPQRIEARNPTVSYSYEYGDRDEVKQTAAKYCFDHYGRSARVVEDVKSGDERVMTFECVVTPS